MNCKDRTSQPCACAYWEIAGAINAVLSFYPGISRKSSSSGPSSGDWCSKWLQWLNSVVSFSLTANIDFYGVASV